MTESKEKKVVSPGAVIEREIAWFQELLNRRIASHANDVQDGDLLKNCPAPALNHDDSGYTDTLKTYELSDHERLILILTFLPYIRPEVLDPFFLNNQVLDKRFTEFGGYVGVSHTGILPTAETAMFLLAGKNIELRLQFQSLLSGNSALFKNHMIRLEVAAPGEPVLASRLTLSDEFREKLLDTTSVEPELNVDFPAHKLTTEYSWDDLVLSRSTREAVEHITAWHKHKDTLMNRWKLAERLKPGYRVLFYGPPGTGKTLTATLLAKSLSVPVFRVDLSKVISKYIGETEKNLRGLFDFTERTDCILFFDEGDALFGQRSDSNTANDRAANQQIAYLLQRIEDCPNVVILATNLRENLDEAFLRRFQSEILFSIPNEEERLRLWENNFVGKPYKLAPEIDFEELARQFEVTGGNIVNVLEYACVKAVSRKPQKIEYQDLLKGVRNELRKEGRSFEPMSTSH